MSLIVFSLILGSLWNLADGYESLNRLVNRKHPSLKNLCEESKDFVVSGVPCAKGNWPWLVLVNVTTFADGHSLCTGTIISKKYIMTAAHCLRGPVTIALHKERIRKDGESHNANQRPGPAWAKNLTASTTTQKPIGHGSENGTGVDDDTLVFEGYYQPKGAEIVAGITDFHDPQGVRIQVEDMIVNKDYSIFVRNDIALLKLEKPLKFGKYINSIKLANNYSEYPGEFASVAGFGLIAEELPNGTILEKNTTKCHENIVPFQPAKICKNYYNDTGVDEKKQIGVGGYYRGIRSGDSGGPLMVNKKGVWYQVGVASFGPAEPTLKFDEKPIVYTRVSYYCDWIAEETKGEVTCADVPMFRSRGRKMVNINTFVHAD